MRATKLVPTTALLLLFAASSLGGLACVEEDSPGPSVGDQEEDADGDRETLPPREDQDIPVGDQDPEDAPNTDDVVARWTFDETSGPASSAGSCDAPGALAGQNIVRGETGKVGQAVTMLGVEEDIAFGPVDCLRVEDGDFTYAVWFKPMEGVDVHAVYANTNDLEAAPAYFGFVLQSGKLTVQRHVEGGAATRCAGSQLIDDGAWSHLAVVREGDALRLYVDGILDELSANVEEGYDCEDFSGDFTSSAGFYHIGKVSIPSQSMQFGLNGTIDDLHVFGRALSQAEIVQLIGRAAR